MTNGWYLRSILMTILKQFNMKNMKKLRFLLVILLVGSIFPIIAYLSNTKKNKIKEYLSTYHPELTYEIESFKKDTFYYSNYDELNER